MYSLSITQWEISHLPGPESSHVAACLGRSLFNYAVCAGKIVLRLASPRLLEGRCGALHNSRVRSAPTADILLWHPATPPAAHHLHLPHFTHDQACLGLHATFSCGFHCILQGCARRLIYMPNGACNTLPFSPLFFCFFLCCCHVFNYPTATAPAAAAAFVAHNLD